MRLKVIKDMLPLWIYVILLDSQFAHILLRWSGCGTLTFVPAINLVVSNEAQLTGARSNINVAVSDALCRDASYAAGPTKRINPCFTTLGAIGH